ncbi:ubiquitin-protein ligase [Rickenella mellea]|uniref:Anaphase-promoting complex subunit 2 n=1 Tax=Rickenella mellea TaxID=50990 RepID=A0A4Y7Q4Q4_9AGAM|nr:ubiquitin-protein ligase [Rickenella mellea]
MTTYPLENLVQTRWQNTFDRLNGGEPGITGLLNISQAWNTAREFLRPRDIREPNSKERNLPVVKTCFDALNEAKLLPRLLETFVEDIRQQESLITAEVSSFMAKYDESEDVTVVKSMLRRLVEWWKAWAPIHELGYTLLSTFNLEFQTHLFSILPSSFPSAFKKLCQSTVGAEPDAQLWGDFERLGLLDRYENLIASVCYEQIEGQVLETCVGRWNEPMLAGLRGWMADKIVPWMILPYARGAKTHEETRSMLQGIGSRFDFHVCKTLCDLRTSEIFDIIVDYPDSNCALLDLKECLQRVDQRSQLVQALRRLNRKRLLHPGADTKDILTQYVLMIRCLRIIDPPGVLLYKVADPVRRYLRERPDTIRSIVASLVGEGGDLVDENEPIQPLQTQFEDYSDPNWEPEAIDAGPEFRTNKPSDVISTLVSIYDSKDLFVKELQVLLAQRLLAIKDGNFEKERQNIEILKLRFGDAALQVCEVMLRDMTDSRRIDQHVQSQKASNLHPTIISKHFWPALQASTLNMPGQFKTIQQTYAKEFTTFKPDKRLRWLPHLGTVELSIELQDRTVEVEVSPLDAAIIELFGSGGKTAWNSQEIIAELGDIDNSSLNKAMMTWIDRGVLFDRGDGTYEVLEIATSAVKAARPPAPKRPAAQPEAPPVVTVQQQEAEQMRVYWKFIEGMLTNLGSLPLDRIQTMLKFAPGYSRTIEQLGTFMEAARREGLVTESGGQYRLNK